ncbi:MAG: hypothetical protein LBJ12_08955 [Oscillospiraceae bacterium]|jgi:hypothetical protein|nr:hypothetical protein [Oscillospiraceae bacterium]
MNVTMKKHKKGLAWKIPLCVLCVILAGVIAVGGTVAVQGISGWHKWEDWQEEHIQALEDAQKSAAPLTEAQAFAAERARTGVDVAKAIQDGVKFNQLRGIITHNSYKQQMPPVSSLIFNSLYRFGVGRKAEFEYTFQPLSDQLNSGVMGLELDVSYTKEKDGLARFLFCHAPLIDMNSSAIDAAAAFREIALWSQAHPKHLPIVLLLEPKDISIPPFKLYGMDDGHLADFDRIVRENLGEALLMPAEMLGGYSDFAAMRKADGWLPLEKTLGKVIALLHPGHVTDAYFALDGTLRTQAMFPALGRNEWENPQASFVLVNDPKEAYDNRAKLIEEQNLIVRSRLDSYPDYTPEEYKLCMESGAQWMSSDYPIPWGEDPNGTGQPLWHFTIDADGSVKGITFGGKEEHATKPGPGYCAAFSDGGLASVK